MSNRALAAAILAAILIASMPWTLPPIAHGIQNFKTFLSLQSLLIPCDGSGSPSLICRFWK